MKMVMAVMPRGEAERVLQALVAADHTATYAETRGGVLRQAQMMLFIAVESEDLEHVLGIVEKSCRSEPRVEKVEGEETANAPMPAATSPTTSQPFRPSTHRPKSRPDRVLKIVTSTTYTAVLLLPITELVIRIDCRLSSGSASR